MAEPLRASTEPARLAVRLGWMGVAGVLCLAQGVRCEAQTPAAAAQSSRPSNDETPGAGPEVVFARPNRAHVQYLHRAQQLQERGRYAEAVRYLGAILESPDDSFLPENDGQVHRSLKSEAQAIVAKMPKAGREFYEIEYGPIARKMLAAAIASGDSAGLTEVARRFFHTEAGYEATYLLGMDHLDHGRPLAGAFLLRRLRDEAINADRFEPTLSVALATCWLRAGMREEAGRALGVLKTRHSNARVVVGSKEKELALLADEKEAVAWLVDALRMAVFAEPAGMKQWTMRRGNPARNAASEGGEPLLSVQWRVSTSDNPQVQTVLERLAGDNGSNEQPLLPSLHPLVVNDVVLMRTTRNLLAVDFSTGKRVWEVPAEDPFESILTNTDEMQQFPRVQQLEQALRYRMFADAAFGGLSSDGQLVFAVEDLQSELNQFSSHPAMFIAGPNRNENQAKTYNRLAAYEIRTGRLKWHVGGSADEFGLPLAGTFFLGPPLPLMDMVFVLGELKSEVRLLALEAKTGKPVWSQQLADMDHDILNDTPRRLSGVSPSYDDGILVCPTSHKSIIALEAATRSLLWGYTYADNAAEQFQPWMSANMSDPWMSPRWLESSLIIANGRVLATPVDSDSLHCLDLLTGKPAWTATRDDDLYLACVHKDNVVLVGRQHVRALNLKDGKPAWEDRRLAYPPGGVPSGTGYLSGNVYYVPMSNAEVVAVDVVAGQIVSPSKGRRGAVPGNLVCYKGKVISQRADAVECYYQLDALNDFIHQRLTSQPTDAGALALQAESLWHQGKLLEAIEALRRSQELSPDPATRQLLREALFDGLRDKFASVRSQSAELEGLLDEPAHRATYHRLMALGLQHAGEYPAALDHYVKLIELDGKNPDLEPIDKWLSIRRDRWIQVQLADLRAGAPEQVRTQLDQWAESRWKTARQQTAPAAVRQFLDYFGRLPLATEARAELHSRLVQSGMLLEAEIGLLADAEADDRSRQATAVARLAALFHQSGRHDDAAICYQRLAGELADVPCDGAKTGRQLTESLAEDDPTRVALRGSANWPAGNVVVEKRQPEKAPVPVMQPSSLEFVDGRPTYFAESTVELQQNPPQLICRDGYGRIRWQLPLIEAARQQHFSLNAGLMRLKAEGHLLLVTVGTRVLAIDTLGTAGSQGARIVWSHDANEDENDLRRNLRMRMRMAQAGALARQQRLPVDFDNLTAVPEAVGAQVMCLRRGRTCLGVEPITGKVVWSREDIPPESTVFGDGEYVIAVPPGDANGKVLRAADGVLLGQRPVPIARLATFGRCALSWEADEKEGTLSMVDVWTGKEVWPARHVSPNSQVTLVEGRAVGVFEPTGHFVLLSLPDGHPLIEHTLPPDPDVAQIHVLPAPDQYVLITQNSGGEDTDKRSLEPMPGMANERMQRIAKARVYAFDLHGKKLWGPVKIEDQYVSLDQPSRLPVLVFGSKVREAKHMEVNNQSREIMEMSVALLAVDRRDGRVVLDEKLRTDTQTYHVVGDPQKKTVDIQLQRNLVRLTFSGDAVQPTPAAATDAKKPTASRAIWDILKKSTLGQ